jgi:hypothetical protein
VEKKSKQIRIKLKMREQLSIKRTTEATSNTHKTNTQNNKYHLNGGESGIEPALHEVVLDEPRQLPLAQHRVDEVHLAKGLDVHETQTQSILNPVVLLISAIK